MLTQQTQYNMHVNTTNAKYDVYINPLLITRMLTQQMQNDLC